MPQLDKLLRAAWVVNFGQPFLLKIWTWDMDGYRHSPDTKPFDKVFFSWNMSRGFIPYHTCVYLRTLIYTWNPNVPCFDWKRPSFGGKTKDKWVPGIYIYNTYIYYIYWYIYIYTYYMYDYAHLSWHVALVFFLYDQHFNDQLLGFAFAYDQIGIVDSQRSVSVKVQRSGAVR